MKYKHIRGATHSLLDSFFGCMNNVDGDDALTILGQRAFDRGEREFTVNWLTGVAAPAALLSTELQWLIDEYVRRYPQFLTSQRASIDAIRSADMTLRFDIDSVRDVRVSSWTLRRLPYTWRALVVDDRGKQHIVERSWEARWIVD